MNADLIKSLREMRDVFEAMPPEFPTDLELAGHYYGLLIKSVPALDAVIEALSKPDAAALTSALTDAESMAYAQFLKRIGYRKYRSNATSVDEAYLMLDAGYKIQSALADARYARR